MIVVKVELHSAITGKITELGQMHICNDDTGTANVANYDGRIMRAPAFTSIQRVGHVNDHRRKDLTIWYLVAKMLKSMGYTK